jgi:membrane protease YdiL (CAAX protease family)
MSNPKAHRATLAYGAAHSLISGPRGERGVFSAARSLSAWDVGTACASLADLSFTHRHGMGALCLGVERWASQIGGKWANPKDVLLDCGLAVGVWASWRLVETAWNRWLGAGSAASIQTYLPQRALEILLWIGVSISAGFCEELIFRGYFQKQFETFTHSRWFALFLQAVLFGISHGYQGIEACVKIACFGALYGLLAMWRKSLRPGMTAHAWSDILSGIYGI